MENQKIINLLDKDDIDSKHFASKKWYIINDENKVNIGTGADNPDTINDTINDTRLALNRLCTIY